MRTDYFAAASSSAEMALRHPTRQESTGNEENRSTHPLEEMGEISPPETGDNDQEQEGEISPPEAGGCSGSENSDSTDKSLPEQIGSSSENGTPKKLLKHRKATIMVAGRARNGKSTALNNIFGLKLTAKVSATSVTQVVNVSEVTKRIALPKPEGEEEVDGEIEEVTLRVIDTPGLGAADIPKEVILKDMKNIIQGEDYTLMYCFSVSPNQIVMEIDEDIVQNLQRSLGKEVWNKCVLLFTFSDHAYIEFEDSKEEYIQHIKNHAAEFQKLLNKIDNSNSIVVETIFDGQSSEKLDQEGNPSTIIAIPVNKHPKKSKKILPGLIKEGQDWTDIVFIELMKKTGEEERTPFIFFRYPNLLLGTSTAGAGAVVGGVAGGVVGFLGGPIGVAAGAALGAALGAAAVSATGFTLKGVISLVNWIKQ